jgi:hypothetical protein
MLRDLTLVLALPSVFVNAAVPQKIVIVLLVAAIPLTLFAALMALREGTTGRWRQVVSDLRFAGPVLGLLVGAPNSFHMAQTIQRLPFNATAKQLAPGILEISALVGLGALVGLVAVAAHLGLSSTRQAKIP